MSHLIVTNIFKLVKNKTIKFYILLIKFIFLESEKIILIIYNNLPKLQKYKNVVQRSSNIVLFESKNKFIACFKSIII